MNTEIPIKEPKHAIIISSTIRLLESIVKLEKLAAELNNDDLPKESEDTDTSNSSLAGFLSAQPDILERLNERLQKVTDTLRNLLI